MVVKHKPSGEIEKKVEKPTVEQTQVKNQTTGKTQMNLLAVVKMGISIKFKPYILLF